MGGVGHDIKREEEEESEVFEEGREEGRVWMGRNKGDF